MKSKSLNRKSEAAFPNPKTLKHFRDKLSDINYSEGNLAPPLESNEVDSTKYQLCQLIARYQREQNILQRDIAKLLGVDESRISDILRGKIENFTLDRLINYAKKLHPNLKIFISAA